MVFNAPNTFYYILLGALFLWIVFLSFLTFRIWRHYNKLTKGVTSEDLIKTLNRVLLRIEENTKGIDGLEKRARKLRENSRGFTQRVKLLRFNPFSDVGGNQSFVISFLDEDKNGIVISSLHSRGSTRWFAKEIVKGKGRSHKLSKEEKQVIDG